MGGELLSRKDLAQVAEIDLKPILVIENSTGLTGAYRSVHTFCGYLRDRFEFHLAVPRGVWTVDNHDRFRIHECRFREINRSLAVLLYFPVLIYNTIKIHRIVRKHAIKVVHVSDLYNMLGVMVKILNPSIYLIYHVRLRRNSYARYLYRYWVSKIKKYADTILCVSQSVKADLGDDPKIELIYDTLSPKWLKTSIQQPDSAVISMLYPAHYIPGKGQNYALQVLEKLKDQGQMVKLKFVGGDLGRSGNRTYLETLKKQARSLGVEELAEFGGPVWEVAEEMKQSHLVLNFSESESFSMVCLEALACGRPVIATRSGGPQEIIRHGQNGLLVDNKDLADMSQAVSKVIADESMRTRFSSNSRVDFDEKFNLEKLAARLAQIYSRAWD